MRLATLALALALLASGCVHVEHAAEPSAACRDGTGLFVKAQHHPGFISYDYQLMFYTLERNGTLTYFRANDDQFQAGNGTGQLRITGSLHNISLSEVRAEMRRVGAYSEQHDYNVSRAWRHTVSPEAFERFCGEVLEEFYTYQARYEDNNVVDCDAFEFVITTHRGTHSSYSYCEAGPDHVRWSFNRLRGEAWSRFGITGL